METRGKNTVNLKAEQYKWPSLNNRKKTGLNYEQLYANELDNLEKNG